MHREPRRACWMAAFALPWAFPALTLLTLWAGSAAQAGEPSDPDAAFRQILLKLGDEFKGRMYTAVEFPKSPEATAAREQARSMGISIIWDCELTKTPEGYYQIQGGIEYAIAKSLAAARPKGT